MVLCWVILGHLKILYVSFLIMFDKKTNDPKKRTVTCVRCSEKNTHTHNRWVFFRGCLQRCQLKKLQVATTFQMGLVGTFGPFKLYESRDPVIAPWWSWVFHVTWIRAARNAKICWIMSQNVFLGAPARKSSPIDENLLPLVHSLRLLIIFKTQTCFFSNCHGNEK